MYIQDLHALVAAVRPPPKETSNALASDLEIEH
jgi:hypothetical protein